MTQNTEIEVTEDMIKTALFDEEGNRYSDADITLMMYYSFRTASILAEHATMLSELVVDAEEADEALRPSQIGFAAYSEDNLEEPHQTGTMLDLAHALRGLLKELNISPVIESAKPVTKKEALSTHVTH